MPGQAAALRRLDNVIWGLVTGVAAITLAASAIGGFQIVIGSYTAAVVAGVLLLATAYHAAIIASTSSWLRHSSPLRRY